MSGTDSRQGVTAVDQDGVRVAADQKSVVDVLFDDQWTWSFNAERDTQAVNGHRLARWPVNLRPFLRGTGAVTVRERFGEQVLFSGDVAFDDSDQRVRIVDGRGRPLIVDKAGD